MIVISIVPILLLMMMMMSRMDAERKAKEMAVLVADLQRMRSETARNAVSKMMMFNINTNTNTISDH